MDPEQDQPNYFPTQGVQQLQQEPGNPRPYMPAPERGQAPPGMQWAGPSLVQQAQQHPLTQLLDAMLPFGMADQLDLQRHLAGLTQIQQDHSAEHLSDADAQSAVGTIMPRLSQLLQKQQKAQAQKMQQGVQQAMQGAALEEGINAIHKKSRAENFNSEVATLVDPVSRHHTFFTQDAKGNWSEVKFDHSHAETEHALEPIVPAVGDAQSSILGGQRAAGGNRSGGLPDDGEGVELPPPVNGDAEAKYLAGAPLPAGQEASLEQLKQQSAQSGQPIPLGQLGQAQRRQLDPSTFEQTIHSGQHTDRYVGGRLVSSDRPAAEAGKKGGISEQQLKGVFELVRRSMPPLPVNAGPHQQMAYMEAQHKLVHSILGRMEMTERHQQEMELKNQAALHLSAESSRQRREEAEHKSALSLQDWRQKMAEKGMLAGGNPVAASSPQDHKAILNRHIKEVEDEVAEHDAREEKRRKEALNPKTNPGEKTDLGTMRSYETKVKPSWMHTQESRLAEAGRRYQAEVNGRAGLGRQPDQGGAGDKGGDDPERQQRVEEQRKKQDELFEAVGGARPAKRPPSKEDYALPSAVSQERVKELLPKVQAHLDAMPWNQGFKEGMQPLADRLQSHLQDMHAQLKRAGAAGRPLTVGERKVYDRAQAHVHRIQRNHGGAEHLRSLPE